MDVGDLAEFRARDVDRSDIPAGAFIVALDAADGSVVGYAALSMLPGSTTAAWHDMTAVRRAYRGRGIARAMKLATIRWAIQNGLETLHGSNDVDNAPMRGLNAGTRLPAGAGRGHDAWSGRQRHHWAMTETPTQAGHPAPAGSGPVRLTARRTGPRPRPERPVHRGRRGPRARGGPRGRPPVRTPARVHGRDDRARRVRHRRHHRARRAGPAGMTDAATDRRAPRSPVRSSPTIDWDAATDDLVRTMRDLIRIPSINPPPPDAPDGELVAARYLAGVLESAGLEPEIIEPVPGRGSVHVRLRGDGTGGDPLLLLSHLDVVPAPPERWTHAPVRRRPGRRLRLRPRRRRHEGHGRDGARRRPAAGRRGAGGGPRPGPRPDPRACAATSCSPAPRTRRPAVRPARSGSSSTARSGSPPPAPINECGAVSTTIAGVRFYPIGVAEKGYAAYRIRVRGTWGHGSMPREDNAAVLAAEVIGRLADPEATRLTPVMARFLDVGRSRAAGRTPPASLGRSAAGDDALGRGHARWPVRPARYARPAGAPARHDQPGRRPRRRQVQRHPGRRRASRWTAGSCPGTTEAAMRARLVERIGPDAGRRLHDRADRLGRAGRGPRGRRRCSTSWRRPSATTTRTASRCRSWSRSPRTPSSPPTSGIPTYGFSPLRLEADERLLERFHGVDERVSVEALRWGLPVLYDVVRRFCA